MKPLNFQPEKEIFTFYELKSEDFDHDLYFKYCIDRDDSYNLIFCKNHELLQKHSHGLDSPWFCFPRYPHDKIIIANAFSPSMIERKFANVKIILLPLHFVKEISRRNQLKSIIGHEGTAKVLSSLLETEIATNRVTFQAWSTKLLVFSLKERISEGKVLTEEDLKKLEYDFYYIVF